MRRATAGLALTLLVFSTPHASEAQRLRDKFSQLFIFGGADDPLFLAGSATSSTPAQVHGRHYIPSAVAENGSVIGFITSALASQVANVPIGATTSGETFRFEGGVPVSTSTSAGPIFAERAQTLGRGRILAGINRSNIQFSSLRGVPIDNLRLTFTHQNVDFPNCDEIVQDDCTKMGVPGFENEAMNFNLALDIHVAVTSFYLTYGLSNRIDLGVVVPILESSLRGQSNAEIVPFGPGPANHFFAGTPDNPVLTASRSVSGKATGIGDIAARLKIDLKQSTTTGVALLFDARFPTGDERDLLGAGSFSGRALGIISSAFGNFSPHANVGVAYSSDETRNDYLLATLGFDHLLARRITLAADLVSEYQLGSSKLELPKPVTIVSPFLRTVSTTGIPDARDDILNGAFGFKFSTPQRITAVTNVIVPLNSGGLRARTIFTLGVEYSY